MNGKIPECPRGTPGSIQSKIGSGQGKSSYTKLDMVDSLDPQIQKVSQTLRDMVRTLSSQMAKVSMKSLATIGRLKGKIKELEEEPDNHLVRAPVAQ